MQYNLKVQEKDIYNDKNRTIVKKIFWNWTDKKLEKILNKE